MSGGVKENGIGTTIIAGIPIPFTTPLFLSIVGVHVVAALGSVATGLVAMLSTKGRGQHPNFGTAYFWSLALVFASKTVLAVARQRASLTCPDRRQIRMIPFPFAARLYL